MTDRTFYKLEIKGIVYLVDPVTTIAYTYDLADPTPIGKVAWTTPSQPPTIDLYPNWQETLAAKLAATQLAHTPHNDATATKTL